MSALTAQLLGQQAKACKGRIQAKLSEITKRLEAEHGVPTLGNFRDPVKEILYIVLSARTNELLYKRAHRELLRRFPNVVSLSKATPKRVLAAIGGAGLGRKRAEQIVGLARKLVNDFGARPQRKLRQMKAAELFAYLTRLPGVGPKSAFCIMMCSMDEDVFPVDVNVQRILERIGVLATGMKHYQAQRIAPALVPSGLSKKLHVGLVVHGRKICVVGTPKCDRCVLIDLCRFGRSKK